MVSVYVKAAIATFLVFLLGMFMVRSIDEQRIAGLNSEVEKVSMDAESARLFLLYMQLEGDSDICPALLAYTGKQAARTFELASSLQEAERNNVLGSYSEVHRHYDLANLELYLYYEQARKKCPGSLQQSVLYFYEIGDGCTQCGVQEAVLNKVRDDCGVRIFAFPSNSDEAMVNALVSKYGIKQTPSVVAANSTLPGLQDADSVKRAIGCS
ncbi:MAG: hypothetical protein NT157_04895 [Candidatus Micrarchaeota archaeon]|nr:hypothetical protein [Candidatus Micrarchaeota archaeon]